MKNYFSALQEPTPSLVNLKTAIDAELAKRVAAGHFKPKYIEESKKFAFSFGEPLSYRFEKLSNEDTLRVEFAYEILVEAIFEAFILSYQQHVYPDQNRTLPEPVLARIRRLQGLFAQELFSLSMGELSKHLPSKESWVALQALREKDGADTSSENVEGAHMLEAVVFVPEGRDWDVFTAAVVLNRWEIEGDDAKTLYLNPIAASPMLP